MTIKLTKPQAAALTLIANLEPGVYRHDIYAKYQPIRKDVLDRLSFDLRLLNGDPGRTSCIYYSLSPEGRIVYYKQTETGQKEYAEKSAKAKERLGIK